jgi:hypothetical protein
MKKMKFGWYAPEHTQIYFNRLPLLVRICNPYPAFGCKNRISVKWRIISDIFDLYAKYMSRKLNAHVLKLIKFQIVDWGTD